MKASLRLLSAAQRRNITITGHPSRSLSTQTALVETKDMNMNMNMNMGVTAESGQRQFNLSSPVDTLRLALPNDVRPLLQYTDLRLAVHNSLRVPPSNPDTPTTQPVNFPITGELLPHPLFRKAMYDQPYTKRHRKILKEQFLRCQSPSEILRIIAVALQNKEITMDLTRCYDDIVRALYRSRDKVTDMKIFETINVVVLRFKIAGLPTPNNLLKIGIKFAARARSLPGMKRYLKMYRDLGIPMSRNQFRAIIAKFSIGFNGHGEIRNGRWKRSDLLQVLLGFQDTPIQDQHHLGCYLERKDWTLLYGWLAVLSRCKASDHIWDEYQIWQQNPDCLHPKQLSNMSAENTKKTRGDYRFVESMAYAGDIRRAWIILKETGFPYQKCQQTTRFKLLQELQYATFWHEQMQTDLLDLYTVEMQKMEQALGIDWVHLGDGIGYHVPTKDPTETLTNLADPDFEFETTYGYPYDLSPEEEKARRNMIEFDTVDDSPLPFHDSKDYT